MSYDNTDQGAIWPNKDKKSDKHPDFTGRLNVNGVEYWVSAWKKKPDASPKAPSLKFNIKRKDEADKEGLEQVQKAAPASGGYDGDAPDHPNGDFDDDIPF